MHRPADDLAVVSPNNDGELRIQANRRTVKANEERGQRANADPAGDITAVPTKLPAAN